METSPIGDLLQLLAGPFNFLRRDAAEVRALMADAGITLPRPNLIYLDEESASPVRGFPVLMSPGAEKLHAALERYLLAHPDRWREVARGKRAAVFERIR